MRESDATRLRFLSGLGIQSVAQVAPRRTTATPQSGSWTRQSLAARQRGYVAKAKLDKGLVPARFIT